MDAKDVSLLISDTNVDTLNLSRYYTPNVFEEVGFMPFIALNENII